MIVEFKEVERVLKTLPIGYYLTRGAKVTLSPDCPATFARVLNDEIIVSYPMIAMGLNTIPDGTDPEIIEKAVRCLLYHEVSHLFVTPTNMRGGNRYNIFEDERMETLLRDYYMKVHFKWFLKLMNGGSDGGDDRPADTEKAFYRLVRFRNYRWCSARAAERLAKVEAIIKEFANIGRNTGSYVCDKYEDAIDELWGAVARDLMEKTEEDRKAEEEKKSGEEGKTDKADGEGGKDSASDSGGSSSDGDKEDKKDSGKGKAGSDKKDGGDKDGSKDKAGDSGEDDSGEDDADGRDDAEGDGAGGKGDGDKEEEEEKDGGEGGHSGAEGDKEGEKKSDSGKSGKDSKPSDSDGESADKGSGSTSDETAGGNPDGDAVGDAEDGEDGGDDGDEDGEDSTDYGDAPTLTKKDVTKLVESLFNEHSLAPKDIAALDRIFRAAEKKRAASAGAVNAHSGIIDPRQVALRSDYRWWLHQNPTGSHSRFAKTHLTLFMDVSGSFHSSQGKLNALVQALLRVKKGNPNFLFDIIAMGDTNRMFNPETEGEIHCCEGNYFGNDVIPLARKCKRSDCENYQLVVFDGDAMSCDGWGTSKRDAFRNENMNAWKIFDDQRTVIVTDECNERYLNKANVTLAKRIVCDCGYAEKFTENVIKLLAGVVSR